MRKDGKDAYTNRLIQLDFGFEKLVILPVIWVLLQDDKPFENG